jgi:hypothetical protein
VDFRSGESFTIGAQHLLADGSIASQWTPDAAHLCIGSALEIASVSIGDGSGGAIVVWVDTRSGDADLYAQHFTTSGGLAPGWPADGLPVCVARGSQYQVALASDAAGGAFAVWQDYRNGAAGDIYAQRILSTGALAWADDGIAVCADTADQAAPAIATDGAGGARVVWQDRHSGDADLRYAHLGANGHVSPGSLGTPIVTATGDQRNPLLVSDAGGGALLVWQDWQAQGTRLRALRLTAQGAIESGWSSGGKVLASDAGTEPIATACSDGSGGAVVAWCARHGGAGDIRAQHVRGDGTLALPDTGAVLCGEPHEQYGPVIAADGTGGAIVAWEDHRAGGADLYAQRLMADGAVAWAADGVPLCVAPGQQFDVSLIGDGAGGVLALWSDDTRSSRATYARSRPVVQTVLPRLKSVESGPGRAHLTWDGQAGDPTGYLVERKTEAEDWRDLATVRVDSQGEIGYEDRGVSPGSMATYRLAVRSGAAVVLLEEIPVNIPAPMPLALRFARSDENGRTVRVSYVLETHAPAKLEFMDVAGRRILTRDLGAPGAGEHEERFSSRLLASGVYFVRLIQGGQMRTARLTLIR